MYVSYLSKGKISSDIAHLLEIGRVSDFNATYSSLTKHLQKQIERVHWSDLHKAYLDVGPHDPNYRIEAEVMVRCQNPKDQMTIDVGTNIDQFQKQKINCPASHPHYMFPLSDPSGQNPVMIVEKIKTDLQILSLQHVKHIGYVSMFPFFLQLLDPSSSRLAAMLDQLSAPEHLWSKHGIRSISGMDPYYRRANSPGDDKCALLCIVDTPSCVVT